MEDLDSLSLEQIQELAEKEAAQQTRDALGRFTKPGDTEPEAEAAPEAEAEPEIEEAEPEVFEETIDLGDGSGVQVFRADSEKALRRKLVDAQLNATRKIREQEQRLRDLEKSAAPSISADERYVLAQRIMTEPDVVIREQASKLLAEHTEQQRRAQMAEQEAAQSRIALGQQWIKDNPEFYESASNSRKMEKFLQTQGLEFTRANLDLAFSEMQDILQPAPAAAKPATAPARKGSSFPLRSTPQAPAPPVDPYNMPLEELEALIQANYRASLQNQ